MSDSSKQSRVRSAAQRIPATALGKRDEEPRTVAMGRNGSNAWQDERPPIQVVPGVVGEMVSPGSAGYSAARALQAARFAAAAKPRRPSDEDLPYLQAVEMAGSQTIWLVARREGTPCGEAPASGHGGPADSVLGAVRLELPGASIIEAVVRFAPGSPMAAVREQQRYLEIGGFATAADLSRGEIVDVIDTLAAAIVVVGREQRADCLWMLPRLPVMTLFLAEIVGTLPPYVFTLCWDVAGWVEEHPQLAALRSLGLKGFHVEPSTRPIVYVGRVETLAADLARRVAARADCKNDLERERRLRAAMLQACRRVRSEVRAYQEGGGFVGPVV